MEQEKQRAQWPDYRAIWRWHFYAGLYCIPFVLFLATTGAVYLFNPQIEAWLDKPYRNLEFAGEPKPLAEQIDAALASEPGSILRAYQATESDRDATHVLLRKDRKTLHVYVHPQSLSILKKVDEDDQFMQVIRRLHGELLMGDKGSYLVELAASWTLVLILTGVILWWPRNVKGLGGWLVPRLFNGSRIFWRDLHSVTGIWISGFATLLILSGLPWSNFWGDYFKNVRMVLGDAVQRMDWTTSSAATAAAEETPASSHGHHHGGPVLIPSWFSKPSYDPATVDFTQINRVKDAAAPLALAPPVYISPPSKDSQEWVVRSMTPNRPERVSLLVDGRTGEVTMRETFQDRPMVDRIVGTGIALHEGQLFGWPNQAIGVFTAVGLVALAVSGVILWWRRRPNGVLGAPGAGAPPRMSLALLGIVAALAIYLPMFGASLLLVLVLEKLVLRRIDATRRWLGLREPAAAASVTME